MKKILSFTLALSLLFILAACTNSSSGAQSQMNDRQQALGFSALSSVLALHNGAVEPTNQASQTTVPTLPSLLTEDPAVLSLLEDVESLRPFLDLVQSFMGGQNNGFQVDIDASSLDDYAYTMLIQAVNIEGESVTYELHYNETFVEIDDDETEFTFVGVMDVDGVLYQVEGVREIEAQEESLELIARLDDENYITVEFEFGTEEDEFETEFIYELFIANQLAKRIEINFEESLDELELELKFVRGTRESEFVFEIEREGNTREMTIEFKISEDGVVVEEGEIEVYLIEDGEGNTRVRYEFELGGQRISADEDGDLIDEDEDDDDPEEEELDDEE